VCVRLHPYFTCGERYRSVRYAADVAAACGDEETVLWMGDLKFRKASQRDWFERVLSGKGRRRVRNRNHHGHVWIWQLTPGHVLTAHVHHRHDRRVEDSDETRAQKEIGAQQSSDELEPSDAISR